MKVFIFFLVFFIAGMSCSHAQCDQLGQKPTTAFPVCGFGKIAQSASPSCGSIAVYVPVCSDEMKYFAQNAYYYKFTCYKSGNLNFLIDPQGGDNYDWMLYDVTGVSNLSDIYTNKNLVVSGNWSLKPGPTGMSGQGTTKLQCITFDPTKEAGPMAFFRDIYAGHNYLLMVSHPSDNTNGFLLNFENGTADITEPTSPHLKSADAPCDGTTLNVKLNKQMQCASLDFKGSDFEIIPHLANVIAAKGIGCSSSFDFDSVHLTLSAPLPKGNYFVVMKKGLDGNTLQDDCKREVPEGEKVPFVIDDITSTPMDSITKLACAPDVLQLVFKKKIKCSSIEKGGSDFVISGPTAVSITGAAGNCDEDGLAGKITVKLAGPIYRGGTYTITLVNGTDGNTLVNECGFPTNAGNALTFTVKDTVNANFTFDKRYGCINDTVNYFHNGNNGVNYWRWTFDKLRSSNLQNPVTYYGSFGKKNTQLIVSNGVCSDTAVAVITLDNQLHASFEATAVICPGERASFKNTSTGDGALTWNWDFDNGNTSTLQQPPPQSFIIAQTTRDAKAQLLATNTYGCSDTAYQNITVSNSCLISVPNAFTPNNDGLNDYLYPLVAYRSKSLLFRVYNRYGQLMFQTTDWTKKWDGKFKGQPADAGAYAWTLQYTNTDTGKYIDQKGTTILIR